jgi:hypothetical protein
MDPDPDPTPDPTPFFNDFKDVKKNYFFKFFSNNLSTGTVHHLQSKKFHFLLNFYVKILFCQALFQSAQHIYGKREGSGSGSVPLTNEDPDPGGPKTCRSCGSGSPSLLKIQKHSLTKGF